MIKIAICGIAGRMCGRIAHLALDSDDIEISGGVEAAGNRAVGRDLGAVIGARPLGVRVVDNLEQVAARADVVVAFTAPPDGTVEAATVAGAAGTAMVVGTTGMSEAQLASFEEAVKDVACVFAPNFTVGVTLLIQLVEEATRILGADYDVEIVEAHHRFKTDAPSGTALALAKAAASGLNRNLEDVGVYGRHGDTGVRTREEIGVHAIRAGDIVGEHIVTIGGVGEVIQIVHRAQSRDAFGVGALRAVRFAAAAAPGFYDMRNVLGIR